MIGSRKQMDSFIARFEPILKRWGSCSVTIETPSKTGRILLHRNITLGKKNGTYFGNFKMDSNIIYGNCIEDILDGLGLVSLIENYRENI